MEMRDCYCIMKPFIPRPLQIYLRRCWAYQKRARNRHIWPIDEQAGNPPEGWQGWPDEKRFALVLTHDVETAKGQDRCLALTAMEENLGFRSSLNFVPERYRISQDLLFILRCRGFEIGLHGRDHNGNPYRSEEVFQREKVHFNRYLRELKCAGFRTPSMYHDLNMIHQLDIEYDASTFDTDPFEPQPEGVKTIFPFYVDGIPDRKGFVELPYTLPQDFTLFILMREKNIDIWKKKLHWVAERGGMVLLITHPDYMRFDGKKLALDEYPAAFYETFLSYVQNTFRDQYWHALPRDVGRFCMQNALGISQKLSEANQRSTAEIIS